MSWEQELKRLDEQLADGRIDRNEYRRLRDDLLAEVSSVPGPVRRPPEPPPALAAEQPTVTAAITPSAAGEPMRWASMNPGALPPDPVGPASGPLPAGPPSGPMPMPVRPPSGPIRIGPPSGATPLPVGPVGETPPGTTRLVPPGTVNALDGAAVFSAVKPEGRGTVRLMIVLVVLVVLGGAAAVWFLGLRPGAEPKLAGQPVPVTTSAPVDKRTLNDIAALLPALPGTAKPGTGIVAPSAGVQLGLYGSQLADALNANGVHTILLRFTIQSSVAGGVATIDNDAVVVIPGGSAAVAARNTSALTGYLNSVGMSKTTGDGLPANVTTMTTAVAGQTVRTAVFQSGDYTVWLAVGRSPANDQSTLSADFQRIASSVIAAVKPS
jgi:hypothetical protein